MTDDRGAEGVEVGSQSKREQAVRLLGQQLLLSIEFIERVQDFPGGPQLREIVSSEMQRGRLRGLRMLERDVGEMVQTLSPQERESLGLLLEQRVGYDAEAAWLAEQAEASRSLAAGRVRSEKERMRLERHLEELSRRGGDKQVVAALQSLLKGS